MQKIFSALDSRPRRQMLAELAGTDLRVGEMAKKIEITKPGAFQYLSLLRAAGLVTVNRRGKAVIYQLELEAVAAALVAFVQEVLAGVSIERRGKQSPAKRLSESTDEFHKLFRALGSPNRRQMLKFLAKEELSVSEMASRFEMTRPGVSVHLSILESAGLVASEFRPPHHNYRLLPKAFESALNDYVRHLETLSLGRAASLQTKTADPKAGG